jgi:predicted metalloendopeptidase
MRRGDIDVAGVPRARLPDGDGRRAPDPHSPRAFRAIGATRNIDDWYAAFGVKPGDAYYLPDEQRVRIW